MKTASLVLLVAALPLPLSHGAPAACPALAGEYGRCVTRVDGRDAYSGSARITQTRDEAGVTRYELFARGGDGTPQSRFMLADGLERRELQRAPGQRLYQLTSTTVNCAADGTSVTSFDEVQLLEGADSDRPTVRYSLRATYRRDRQGNLRVRNEWSFEKGPLTLDVTCTPGPIPAPLALGTASGLPPGTDLVTITRGFRLIPARPLALAPRSDGAAVFVAQHGRRHAGIWAWRGDRFVVLRDAADPRSDIALDPDSPSCQVHIDAAPREWSGPMEFQAMTYQGAMPRQGAHVYAATSADAAEQVFMTCLTGRDPSGARRPFRVADLRAAWGDVVDAIESR
jgi:hypothetical protein